MCLGPPIWECYKNHWRPMPPPSTPHPPLPAESKACLVRQGFEARDAPGSPGSGGGGGGDGEGRPGGPGGALLGGSHKKGTALSPTWPNDTKK